MSTEHGPPPSALLFDEHDVGARDGRGASDGRAARRLPVIGEQKDIRYHASAAQSVLNGPETTGMDFWSINPYVGCAFGCAYCYARYAHRYAWERALASMGAADTPGDELRDAAALPAWLAFERHVLVKENAAAALRDRLVRLERRNDERWRALRAQGVTVGTATDPYQPAERRFRVTRAVLEVLADFPEVPVGIITKSPLVTRDADLLRRLSAGAGLTVHVTITTLDRELARRIEPRAPTPDARVRAVARLSAAGVDVGVNVMPVLPGITDAPEMLDALVGAVARAGATHVGACALRLRRTARERYLPFVAQEFPALADRYRRSYARGHQLGTRYRDGLRAFFVAACERHGIRFGYGSDAERAAVEARTLASQLELAL